MRAHVISSLVVHCIQHFDPEINLQIVEKYVYKPLTFVLSFQARPQTKGEGGAERTLLLTLGSLPTNTEDQVWIP